MNKRYYTIIKRYRTGSLECILSSCDLYHGYLFSVDKEGLSLIYDSVYTNEGKANTDLINVAKSFGLDSIIQLGIFDLDGYVEALNKINF